MLRLDAIVRRSQQHAALSRSEEAGPRGPAPPADRGPPGRLDAGSPPPAGTSARPSSTRSTRPRARSCCATRSIRRSTGASKRERQFRAHRSMRDVELSAPVVGEAPRRRERLPRRPNDGAPARNDPAEPAHHHVRARGDGRPAAPLVVVGGLEEWNLGPNKRRISEDRLVAKIQDLLKSASVDLFAPPTDSDDPRAVPTGITAWQFPEWFIGQTSARLWSRRRPLVHHVRSCRTGAVGDTKTRKRAASARSCPSASSRAASTAT